MQKTIIKPELKFSPNVEVTLHAVDRFSQRGLQLWESEGNGEGIMSFLLAKSKEAYAELLSRIGEAIHVDRCRITHENLVYVFSTDFGKTRLITVYPSNEINNEDRV